MEIAINVIALLHRPSNETINFFAMHLFEPSNTCTQVQAQTLKHYSRLQSDLCIVSCRLLSIAIDNPVTFDWLYSNKDMHDSDKCKFISNGTSDSPKTLNYIRH